MAYSHWSGLEASIQMQPGSWIPNRTPPISSSPRRELRPPSTSRRICSNANVLTEEDVHNPFAGPTVPLLGNRAGASVAVENGVRFAEDAMRIGSDQDVGSDLACDRALRVGAHGEAGHTQHSRLLLDAATLSVRTMRELATRPRNGR